MYLKSKIYKITDIGYNECYYGSTVQSLSKRMGQHREKYHKYKKGEYHYITSFNLFDKYGLENCKIELVENYECKSKEELQQREAFWIKNNECVNKIIPGRTYKEWVEDNKEEIKEKKKKYQQDNKEVIKEKKKVYYENNKEKFNIEFKKYREEHKDEILTKLKNKVICEICNKEISLRNLNRHKNEQHNGIVRIR